jgi:hypothetical protein
MKTFLIGVAAATVALGCLVAAGIAAAYTSTPSGADTPTTGLSGCTLNSVRGKVKHVVYIQFDNLHFTRDNPNVPSDLEQMPRLLNFIEQNGVLATNHHTPLISNTATGILTSLTGVYGDRMGVPVANSFRYFNPDGTTNPGVSYAYWTSPLFDPTFSPTDTTYNMLTAGGQNAPAPWVPYTRAGCNFGSLDAANTILENTAVDIPAVFGAGSPEAAEAQANPAQAAADFVGIGIHCAKDNAVCSTGQTDSLPEEPGGYTGFQALFGNKFVAPQISPSGPMTDLNGNVIQDATGHVGFPGLDGMSAAVSLSYVAAMQEHNVPVTYAYISDAHDGHPNGPVYGPGEAGYVATLKSYDDAFGKFFARLAADGINQSNTLFVFTADEGDHFVGGPPSPANCDGVTIPCTYGTIGEVNANLRGLLATQQGITTPFILHSDSAPTVYITGNPARDTVVTRTFERATGSVTATDPITGHSGNIAQFLADPVEMKLLHMVTADPARTPTFTMFADPDYFLFAGAQNCNAPCVQVVSGFAWNHGDVQPDITTTWLGMVGPGVDPAGIDSSTWSDHSDIRPTMMTLLGLKDDYAHDGRALVEDFEGWAIPAAAKKGGQFVPLAQMYKHLDAAVGEFGLATLRISTKAIESGSPTDDSTYTTLENRLSSISQQRDALTSQMNALLEGAEFGGQPIPGAQARQLIAQGQSLLDQVNTLAGP